ncbi:peroxiredoxin [Zavarzinia compransoris]|uniref:peroxiredoxin n=1 Tax=Zavarzinia compransoris TaxID=1264899 RepID=UPI0010ED207F|nr:peroxiredoxin [Zavarzinia compransoris]TDP43420.1 1-Cys peroxiredoxin [Zavarzinia compransoris]
MTDQAFPADAACPPEDRLSPHDSLPLIGEAAPDFQARSTMGVVTLSDYRGRWVLLLSHPADFTPVCTSEFVAVAKQIGRFRALGCEVVALSVDSLFAHIAWSLSIEEKFGVAVDFPIVEDVSLAISRAFGMVHPKAATTATIRAAFVIDPDGIIQAIQYYPMAVGRSVGELLRLIAGLQAAQDGTCSVPADWQAGDPVLAPPPLLLDEARHRRAPAEGGDWYFTPAGAPAARGRKGRR